MLHEKILYPEIPTVKIESFTASNFNLSNPIFAHWKINMSMHNNKSSFEFSDSAISVFHQEEVLWMARLQGFDMRPKNTTFHFALDLGRIIKINDTTVRAIGDKIINNHGAIEFNVQFKSDHPRGMNINPLLKFYSHIETNVRMLVISCDVLLLFRSPDKTEAYMLMTDKQACSVHVGQ
ncbi:hypothetical protein POM88_047345 [Heracleum sosnowskyi]|uniref:Uncharacterized protein n=1 Tax=Heracleum sosnowskyi TaxID=360622 RepID=A0AAD8GTQ3_9APIA|nr:hypothetical protein POM88_047345 [Heracleum sosnowskyi]